MEPLSNENETSSPIQRLLIGAGTLIVVILTVVAAVFLAMRDMPSNGPPPAVLLSTPTPLPVTTATNTSLPIPSPTNSPGPIVTTPTTIPTLTPTLLPPSPTAVSITATYTPQPSAPPTFTPTPAPADASPNTPTPAPPPTQASTEGDACQTPDSWVTYQVETGDTLNKLSARTNVSVFDLQQVNCLESFTIRPGQTIYLPFTPPTPTPTNIPGPTRTRAPTPTRTSTPVAPKIFDVIVQVDLPADEIAVFVTGENFKSREQGFRAELVGFSTIPLKIGEAKTRNNFEARAPLAELAPGEYDLVVINPDGYFDMKKTVFPPGDATPTATPAPPEITRVSPSSGQISNDVRLTIQGRNFRPLESGFRIQLQLEDGSLTVEVSVDQTIRPATSTSFDAFIPSGTLLRGIYDLLVTNPNGQTDIERFAYDAVE